MSHQYRTRSTSAKKTPSDSTREITSNSNHNSNGRSHSPQDPTEINSEQRYSLPGSESWQPPTSGTKLQSNPSLSASSHHQGIDSIYTTSTSNFNHNSFNSSTGINPFQPLSINIHFSTLYLIETTTRATVGTRSTVQPQQHQQLRPERLLAPSVSNPQAQPPSHPLYPREVPSISSISSSYQQSIINHQLVCPTPQCSTAPTVSIPQPQPTSQPLYHREVPSNPDALYHLPASTLLILSPLAYPQLSGHERPTVSLQSKNIDQPRHLDSDATASYHPYPSAYPPSHSHASSSSMSPYRVPMTDFDFSQPTTSSNLNLRNFLPSQLPPPVRTVSIFGAEHLSNSPSAPPSRPLLHPPRVHYTQPRLNRFNSSSFQRQVISSTLQHGTDQSNHECRPDQGSDMDDDSALNDGSEDYCSELDGADSGDDYFSDPEPDSPSPNVDDNACYNEPHLILCGCFMDVCRSRSLVPSLPLPSLVRAAVARFQSPVDSFMISQLAQSSVSLLNSLYNDGHVIQGCRAGMIYMCALTMHFLYDPVAEGTKRMKHFMKYQFNNAFGQELATQDSATIKSIVMMYFKMIHRSDIIFHSKHSILKSYSDWFNGKRDQDVSTRDQDVSTRGRDVSTRGRDATVKRDNYFEYHRSREGLVPTPTTRSFIHDEVARVDPLIIDCPAANPTDIAQFQADEDEFYSRSVSDMTLLQKLLHRRHNCCMSVFRVSHNEFSSERILERLDDLISILSWIVSEFVHVPALHPDRDGTIYVSVSRYDRHPYEDLLGWAYNLRLLQTKEHRRNEECCRHYFRPSFADDTPFPFHWHRWDDETRNIPIEPGDHAMLVPRTTNEPRNWRMPLTEPRTRSMTIIEVRANEVRNLGIQVNSNFAASPVFQIPLDQLSTMVINAIRVHHWYKNHDHVNEEYWQKILCYLHVLYASLADYKESSRAEDFRTVPRLEDFCTMYVPSYAARHNSSTINPLQQRRLLIIQRLKNSKATKVIDPAAPIQINPAVSILRRLFCPLSITSTLGHNIMRKYIRHIYMVDDVHAVMTHCQSGGEDIGDPHHPQRYLHLILYLDRLLQFYAKQNMHPKYVVYNLHGGHFLFGQQQSRWREYFDDLPTDTDSLRKFITLDRLQKISAYPIRTYADMSDEELTVTMQAIQQFLVEYGICFMNGPISSTEEMENYEGIPYFVGGPDTFIGFNFMRFHSHLLIFWYHDTDNLYSKEMSLLYINSYMERLIFSIDDDQLIPDAIRPWLQWAITILQKSVTILQRYFEYSLRSYRAEDKNRVTLLVWEVVLSKLDNIHGPFSSQSWNKDLLHEIRRAYIVYHSNISYAVDTDVKILFAPDWSIHNVIGSFDDSPDSSNLPSRHNTSDQRTSTVPTRITPSQLLNGTALASSNRSSQRTLLPPGLVQESSPAPVPPPAYQPPPIHRTLTDDEKKRRVQRNLLPPDDPPELMSDNSDDEYNRPLTYDEDPIHSSGHDVTLVPVPNPTGRPSTHEMEERSLQYATDQLRVIQDNYPSLLIDRSLTSKLQSSPVLSQPTVSSMQGLNEVRTNQASSMYNEQLERSLREARAEIRALRLQIQSPLAAPSPDPPLLADNDKASDDESPEESPDLSSYLIPIAIPTDKIDQFARTLKQDSQLQSFVSSQSSSTMYPAIVQSIPPLPLAPVVAPVVPSDPPIASQSEVPVARRRIPPAHVDTINKRQHFPTTLHVYFDGVSYPPGMSQVEVEYLDDCIIQHCCQNNRMEKLPQLDEQALQAIKVFQNDNLIQQLVGTHIAPSLMLEVMYNYMEGIFIVQRSTIPNSGDGLFLRPGKTLQQGILLPYPGVILSQVSTNQLVENDKLVCLRKSIYLDGSSAQVFPVSGNTYPNFLAKANESVCHNMMEANKGKIINCGMVLFEDRIPASPMCTEIFVLYSPLTTSVQALSEEPPHRTTIKQKVLLNLFEHMDDVFLGSHFYMEENFRSNVKSYFRKIQDKEVSINFSRVLGRHTVGDNDSVVRYIQACISVVDGRFMDHVKQVYPKVFKAIASKSTITVSFNNITRGQIYLPIALLLHIHSWFYYGNYQDPVRSVEIRRQGTNHHRNMIQTMITDNILVTSSNQLRKLLLQHGIIGFTNPRFTMENLNNSIDESTDDDSDNEEDKIADLSVHGQSDDEVIISSSTRSSPTPSNHRTSPVPMTTMIQDSVHVQVAPVPVSSVNASCPPQPIFNRHEKADEEIEIPVTPLTMQTQRENLRQDMRAILYQEGQLPLAPRYEASQIYRTRDTHHHRDRHSRESYHDQHSRPSFSTQEMEQGLQDYDPNILPNTIQEALRWSGTNNKTYDYYLPEDEEKQKGNLSGHPLVKNSLDMQTQSTLYNDIMVLTTILLTFWSVDIANYHRLDRVKGDFALNDRAKIATFDTKYDGASCLYTYTGRLLQHFAQHRLPYVLLYNILSKGTDLSGGALIEWQAQVDSANSSLVPEDITNTLLRAPSLHCYQMRSIVEMIVDLIVFRVLIFNQLKNKTVIRQELFQLKMESNIGSVTYDGILALSQKIIRTFRLFLLEDNVVQDLVKTLAGCIKNSGPAYAQKAADFHSAMSTRVKDFVRDQRDAFRSLDRQEQNIRIFAVIELYCRELQDSLRQSFNINGQSLAMTSPASPSYATASPGKTYHTSSSFRPRGLPSPTPSFKRVNVHSASLQSQDVQHQQSHYHHISDRVDCEINQVHMFAQAKTLRDLLDDQFEELPAGAVLTVAEGATEPTIHVQVAHVYDMDVSATTTAVIDTRYTIDKAPYDGNCTLCGDRRHDKKHCRLSSYEHPDKVNLVNYSYFSEDILMDKIQRAKDHGFLRGATQDEINWVLEKIKELRQQRALLYANKSVGNSNYPSRGTPPRSGSPYGYHRPPSPYERQPFHSVPTQSL